MKEIQLTQGYVALVDDEDYERAAQYKWCASVQYKKDGSILNVYANHVHTENGSRHTWLLHRFILGIKDSAVHIDHSPDHSGLNCVRGNLRHATRAENQHNQRLNIRNTSGVKGVSWNKRNNKWLAYIKVEGSNRYLGSFSSIEDAKKAYDTAALHYFGQFACTNEMMEAIK
jgi:hypothetical protein